jgi:hypothetical protein
MDLTLPYCYRKLNKPGHWIQVFVGPDHSVVPDGAIIPITEDQADEIMAWSMAHRCGVRMSFDTWRFNSEQDMVAFVLKWC